VSNLAIEVHMMFVSALIKLLLCVKNLERVGYLALKESTILVLNENCNIDSSEGAIDEIL